MESVHVSSTPPSSFMYFPKLCPPTITFSPVLPFYLIQINIVYISNLLPVACSHLFFFLSPLHAFYYHHILCVCVFLSLSYSLSLSLHALFYISSSPQIFLPPTRPTLFCCKVFLQKDFSKLLAFQSPKIKMIEVYIGNWFCIAQIMFQSSIK